jgi:hypothetical protein
MDISVAWAGPVRELVIWKEAGLSEQIEIVQLVPVLHDIPLDLG